MMNSECGTSIVTGRATIDCKFSCIVGVFTDIRWYVINDEREIDNPFM
jgi:hypothetical protein